MGMIESGTYAGRADGLTFDFRVEHGEDGGVRVVSGDISRGGTFVASFLCVSPALADGGQTVTGALAFRGNAELFTGSLYLTSDARGIGSFRLTVDLEGGNRDVFAGRADWQGSFLRRLVVEMDGIAGTRPPAGFALPDGTRMTVERAFAEARFDAQVRADSFPPVRGGAGARIRGFTLAEIHAGMLRQRSAVPADRLHVHVLVCGYLLGRNNRGVLGVMYDFAENDINRRPREGVAVFYDHPMLSDPRVPQELREREYTFTLVHEIGHALNLLHSFDKARPAALSWMNYPDLYPRGYEAGGGHDGSQEFWRRFRQRFDEDELQHLCHASPREIAPGGFAFGVYEEGASLPFGGEALPRRTRIGANPLRAAPGVTVSVRALKREYALGEPVFVRIGVRNDCDEPVLVPDALDPTEGYVRLLIRTPAGRVMRYRPPVRLCKQAPLRLLEPGGAAPPFDHVPVFLSAEGPVFAEPGEYLVQAEMAGIDGSRNAASEPTRVRVVAPGAAGERFAQELFASPGALQSLYLRNPLVDRDAFNALEEALERAGPRAEGDTTGSYVNFVAGLGWMQPFAPPLGGEREADPDKAARRLQRVDPRGLPASVRRRVEAFTRAAEPPGSALRSVRSGRLGMVVTRPEERGRLEVPPSGLFGALGLSGDLPRENAEGGTPLDPFVRVVGTLAGSRRFADVVSWNIENLHSPQNFGRIPDVAEFIRSLRCDFWGLQEVGDAALRRLVQTLNTAGQVRYEYLAVEGGGQQSGALFRSDTTTVRRLPLPPGFFENKIDVEMRDGTVRQGRDVFLRKPLLCDVRVRQQEGVFDFRCAIVHLKSTDPDYRDRGEGMRLAAAEELVRWMRHDREAGDELDYLIMGDMNAETARQGLGAFTTTEDLKLLSVGMQDRYDDALTRVASGRLLDHIVVTRDAVARMPDEDLGEQIIIRADTELSGWTEQMSDHVPVAVRFVLGADTD
jgi:endonuclease/exonuclease/phosphatase family metal-dependent hydrolase